MKERSHWLKWSLKVCLMLLILMAPVFAPKVSPVQASQTQTSTVGDDQLLKEIKERGVIRMGVNPHYPPFEFLTRENGQNKTVGVDISLGEKIAEDLGVKLEVVNMEFTSLMSSLEAGNIDMIISGMTYTEERDKSVDFSDPYENDRQAIMFRKEDEGKIKDKDSFTDQMTIGVQQATYQEDLAKEFMPQAKMLTMQRVPDLLGALTTKQIDGILVDELVAYSHANAQADISYVDAGLPSGDKDGKAVVIPERQPSLQKAINQSVAEVKDQNLVEKWTDELAPLLIEGESINWLSYWPFYWDGIKLTLLISAVAIVCGLILGAILALMRISNFAVLNSLATAYVEFLRGTPLMIQVLFIFLGIGGLLGIGPLAAGLIAVSLNSGAYICEIIRGGLQSVPKGQMEAARSLGLSYGTTMKKVIFPQSLRAIWPSLGNEFITLIKESSIVSTIGVAELTFQTRAVTSQTYQGIIPLFISMVIYFILTFALSKLLNYYEKKMQAKY
ncbi:ABC transporter substrate-binding protein/permease [Aerococcus sanguinicola]|uniref:Amino acid ABC transporter n=2 Tax=Aerococcus sanguinicola TaxID=119206 RepID=A0A0X8FAF8_9LACT|nr:MULTISPECIES: ABC transporter substrate-binding protein/permease [Aerococcus]AMB93734.1 amino acid ABC transporter [Aerococcus sanguinicola]MDK7050417.1 ABC transporter substrate-binding protein/permease [Aerococcus sanguinicola]OFT94509.1 amino acid ABC transporter [Aerococcus sp. HMSC23C02]